MMSQDTIAAIATGLVPSGIGIIRISGEDAFSVIDRIYLSVSGKKRLSACESHTVHYGYIHDSGKKVDEVMVILMRAPHSYTRENCVEINCHGGVYVMKRILDLVITNGARLAEPGEFTKRAFLNGRIDLAQAESVIDVIHSKNSYALQNSLQQLQGALGKRIQKLREQIIHELAFIEAALDDPEHYSMDGYPQQLLEQIQRINREMEELLRGAEDGRLLRDGIGTVITGKPNAGKSSVLNVLAGEERAIVTEIAGTTRDLLEEQVILNGIVFNIMDTAGIHETEDEVEKIGVNRARERIEKADLILFVIDSSIPLDENDRRIVNLIREKNCIILLNKSDLDSVVKEEEVRSFCEEAKEYRILYFSAKKHEGTKELTEAVTEMFFSGSLTMNEELCISNLRHKQALRDALDSLTLVKKSIEDGMPEDFFSIDLMNAYESLGTIIGKSVEDDLVEEIFSKFCMGK